jgi:hypothetical protein
MKLRRLFLVSVLLSLLIHFPTLSNADSHTPFGIDCPFPRPFPPTHTDVAARSNDLGLVGTDFISDTVFRSAIEHEEGGEIRYRWRSLNMLLSLYVGYLNATVWLCINPTTSVYSEGSVEVSPGLYLPYEGDSMIQYKKFLRKLIKHCRRQNWVVAYWGVHNEPHHDYLKAFPDDPTTASKAYCKLVKTTYTGIRNLDPVARIVLGGLGSNTSPQGRQFLKKVFRRLNQLDPDRLHNGYFDYADYHNYNYHTDYKTNRKGHDLTWFREEMLIPFNFGDKEIFIKEGATHTGKDVDAGPAASNYQSESDQAGYLVRRFIYNFAHGASRIQWTILLERDTFKKEKHSFFCYIGLAYNGLPTGDEEWFDVTKHVADPKIHVYADAVDPTIYHFVAWLFEENVGWRPTEVRDTSLSELSQFLSPSQLYELQQNGEIWISAGIKKLSFYTYKFLLDKLRNCDWQGIEILEEDADEVYLYKFLKAGRPIYIAWWDWFSDPETAGKTVTLTLPDITTNSAVVTQAIPGAECGAEAEIFLEHYPSYFAASIVPVSNNTITVTLGYSPVYIEETAQ